MELIPAIDLLDGQCVRLMHGDFNEVTYYDIPPERLARTYREDGASWLHVVDLEASRDGEAADTAHLFKLLGSASQSVQTGGGVRSGSDIRARLDAGASRVVIGSLCALDTPRFLRWVGEYGEDRIVAALDVAVAPDGTPWPRVRGWTEEAGMDLWTLMDTLAEGGLRHALITDIGRDGALKGPNRALYQKILERYPDLQLQASGGVSHVDDLLALKADGAAATIVGKALLEGAFGVSQAIDALK
ncbi:MAG: 1-(5-phosphoribosyl)-5-[(5-phosphoribosylamino)methylideneamino] imidazole-4-carboxamide isomerase [Xanthomonadales bacterium]|jgi:phosphoribosylformimino-5-aminoimidazole carboxamide ribotide isomerase|nr:1-(5-phosphoribosyl)-5-[(5-phosphoribosylamino)methylideneamino] imidazole-4-carboxamide isomerase [Xanthomonadales bacterium]